MSEDATKSPINWRLGMEILLLVIAVVGCAFGYSQWNAFRQEVDGRVALSQQDYRYKISPNWTLAMYSEGDSYAPSTVSVTPIFFSDPEGGLENAVGATYEFDPDQIHSSMNGATGERKTEIRGLYSSLCGHVENIDRCGKEKISSLKIQLNFPNEGQAVTLLDAPPAP